MTNTSPWTRLSEDERLMLAPKLLGLDDNIQPDDQRFEAAAERFNCFVVERDAAGEINRPALSDNILTAQNFMAHTGARGNSPLWQLIAEIKGFRRSYLELTVKDRDELLRVLKEQKFVINREPFWTIHKFDSARARTVYSDEPSLHFANDRANEDDKGYGPKYFFVHWDRTSCWFRKSKWPVGWMPGMRVVEQLYAALHHRAGFASPMAVKEYLKSIDEHP